MSFTSRLTLGDDMARIQWRTKQNLDISYLMMYADDRGKLYLHLEDDLTTVPNFVSTIKEVRGRSNIYFGPF
jgi:alpha-1,3-mannosylglycoprotein beta-1,4-N-acetylglucosaminyltransferase A/B